MNSYLWLPWILPSFNNLLDKRGEVYTSGSGSSRRSRGPKVRRAPIGARESRQANGYSVLKKHWEEVIGLMARARGFAVAPGCWDWTYLFVEPNIRRDPSNVASAAVKLVEDALQRAGLMDDDDWSTVRSIHSYFVRLPEDMTGEGILVCFGTTVPTASEMLAQAKVMSHAERFHRKERRKDDRRAQDHQVGARQPDAPAGEPEASGG